MRKLVRKIAGCMIIAAALVSAGCAAAPVALMPVAAQGVVAGASGGISYSITNVATKVTNNPMEEVAEANLKALDKLGIEVVGKTGDERRIDIEARTERLRIYITVEYITPVLTRLKVNAKRGLITKDKDTAFMIVLFTDRYLYGLEQGPAGITHSKGGQAP